MPLQQIFELIRKRDVVIFCGAGMSIAAGYPSGWALSQLIYGSLTPHEKDQIQKDLPLPQLAEEYINLKMGKRNSLNAILKETFSKEPGSLSLHQILPLIPQIETIITTNYDILFERVYGNDANIVKTSDDVPYIKVDKPLILKIHGDLRIPDSILISTSDYTRFFDSQKEELLWTLVKERMATKNILFIGYNLEDINIESIFNKISEQLGSNIKEVFLLSPSLKPLKINTLTRKGINYIDSKAEDFFTALLANIKENVHEDFQKRYIGADTFRKILNDNNLKPSLTADKDSFKLSSIDGINKPVEGKMQFRIDYNNKELIKKFRDFFEERITDEFTIDVTNAENISFELNGIRLSKPSGEAFSFKSVPVFSGKIDLSFDKGKEHEDILIEIYRTKDQLVIVIPLPSAEIRFALPSAIDNPKIEFDINYKHSGQYKGIKEEIAAYEFLHDLGSTESITIRIPGQEPFTYGVHNLGEFKTEADQHLFYLRGAKRVERHFNIKIGEIGEISEKDFELLCYLLDHIDKRPFIGHCTDKLKLSIDKPEHLDKLLESIKEKGVNFQTGEEEVLEFHSKKINLGYRIIGYLDPIVENEHEVRSGKSNILLIRTGSDSISITHVKADEPSA